MSVSDQIYLHGKTRHKSSVTADSNAYSAKLPDQVALDALSNPYHCGILTTPHILGFPEEWHLSRRRRSRMAIRPITPDRVSRLGLLSRFKLFGFSAYT